MDNNLCIEVARIHKLNGNSKIKAFIDIKINDSILIKGLKIVEGTKGIFVSLPQEKGKNDQYYDSIRPLNKLTKSIIINTVLGAYNQS